MAAFVTDLASNYKKTQHLREALTHSWAAGNLHYRCLGEGEGDTILHIAAKMGETKLVSIKWTLAVLS